jgi:hypothetical protein
MIRLWTCAMIGATLAGCATSGTGPVGAPTARGAAGPTVVGRPTLPRLIPRPRPSQPKQATVQVAGSELSDRIDQALARVGDAAPATQVAIKAAAGNQLQIEWVAGVTWPDPQAQLHVREHVRTILDVVQHSRVRYGTVLLLAIGPTTVRGSDTRTTSIVVRAKYSHALVERTDWTKVPPQDVLGLCDDKRAVIAAGYR